MVYFQTVSSHSQKFFKIGVLKNFVKLTKMYLCRILFITLQHNFLEFENKKKLWLIFQLFISFLVIRMWSFFFLAIIDFNSDLNFINRNSSFVDRYGCMKLKVVSGNRFSACAWLAEMSRFKILTGRLLSWVCCSLMFSSVCFFSCVYYFPD